MRNKYIFYAKYFIFGKINLTLRLKIYINGNYENSFENMYNGFYAFSYTHFSAKESRT